MGLSYSMHLAYGVPVRFTEEPDDPWSFEQDGCVLLQHGSTPTGDGMGWVLVFRASIVDLCGDSKHPDTRLVPVPDRVPLSASDRLPDLPAAKWTGAVGWYLVGHCS